MIKLLARLKCLLTGGHWYIRRAVDPTLKQTTLSYIACVHCEKVYRKDHLSDLSDVLDV